MENGAEVPGSSVPVSIRVVKDVVLSLFDSIYESTRSLAFFALSRGMYSDVRRCMGSEGHNWLAFRKSAMEIPYLRETPGSESFGET